VVGLVSGRLTNKYYKPSLVITKTKEGYKGSGRSIPELNLVKAIEKASDHLERFGGHPAAAGFSLKNDQIDRFSEEMEKIVGEELTNTKLIPTVSIDCVLDINELNDNLVKSVVQLEPFGSDNPKPVFLSEKLEVMDIITMGLSGQHLKLRVRGNESKVFSAIAFNRADKWDLKLGGLIDMVYTVEFNEFNGKKDIQMKIIDIKLK